MKLVYVSWIVTFHAPGACADWRVQENITSFMKKEFTTVLAVGLLFTSLQPSLILVVVGLLSLRVFPVPSIDPWVVFRKLVSNISWLEIGIVLNLWNLWFSAWPRWEEDWDNLCSMWWALGSCFQRRGIQDPNWWTPLRQ